MVQDLDDLDKRIIKAIKTWSVPTPSFLAKQLSIPRPTIERRIHILEKKGIIKGYAYAYLTLNFELLVFRVLIKISQMNQQQIRIFEEFCARYKSVVTLSRTLGSWSFEMRSEFEHPIEAINFQNEIYQQFPHLVREVLMLSYLGTEKLTGYSP